MFIYLEINTTLKKTIIIQVENPSSLSRNNLLANNNHFQESATS